MNINLHNSCKQQDGEVLAVKLHLTNINIVIISICRSPSRNFYYLFKKSDSTLNQIHSNKTEVIYVEI